MRTRQKSGIGPDAFFSSTQTISLEILLPSPLGATPSIDQVVSIVVAGHIMPRKYQVRKRNKKETNICHHSAVLRQPIPTLCRLNLVQNIETVLYTGVGQAGCGGGSIGRAPSSLGVAAIGVLGMGSRIHVAGEIRPRGCACVAGRESTCPKQARDWPLPRGRSCSPAHNPKNNCCFCRPGHTTSHRLHRPRPLPQL